jgi:hypothetical protein
MLESGVVPVKKDYTILERIVCGSSGSGGIDAVEYHLGRRNPTAHGRG